jgi:UDP-glucuronate decarboxylase
MRLMAPPGSVTGPINLGNPGEFSMLEVARHVIDLTGSRSSIVFHPLPVDDPRQRRPDIGAANDILSCQPRIALRDGLSEAIACFDDLLREDTMPELARATA